jgi:hypothetical protein
MEKKIIQILIFITFFFRIIMNGIFNIPSTPTDTQMSCFILSILFLLLDNVRYNKKIEIENKINIKKLFLYLSVCIQIILITYNFTIDGMIMDVISCVLSAIVLIMYFL